MTIPVNNLGWKRSPVELAAVFEQQELLEKEKEFSANHVLIILSEETDPVMERKAEVEAFMIQKQTKLGQS